MTVILETPYERAVNRWEYAVVEPEDRGVCTLPQARAVAAHVWGLLALPGRAPDIQVLPPHMPGYISGAIASVARGGHISVYQPGALNTVTVLHEMAHVLTNDPLDRLERRRQTDASVHGRTWLSNYVFLLDRLMGPALNTFRLRATMPALLQPEQLPYYPTIWGQPRGDV